MGVGILIRNKLGSINGFTLIELLIVIGLLGILAAIGIPAYQDFSRTAKIKATMANLKHVKSYMEAEIQKCLNQTTPISFVYRDFNNIDKTLSISCPDFTGPNGPQVQLVQYIQIYMYYKITNPYSGLNNRAKNGSACGGTLGDIDIYADGYHCNDPTPDEIGRITLVACGAKTMAQGRQSCGSNDIYWEDINYTN